MITLADKRLESALEEYFMKQIRLRTGGIAVKLMPTQRGIPDRLVILPPGELFLVELKTVKGHVSEIQRFWHAKLAHLGVEVHTLYGKAEIDPWISWAVNAAHDTSEIRARVRTRRNRQAWAEHRAELKGVRV